MIWDRENAWFQDGKLVHHTVQDVGPILDDNKRQQLRPQPKGEMRRAASIPMAVVQQWRNEGVDVFDPNHMPEVRRRLNSSQWRWLRTSETTL